MDKITIIPTKDSWKVEYIIQEEGVSKRRKVPGLKNVKELMASLDIPNEVHLLKYDTYFYYDDKIVILKNFEKNIKRPIYKLFLKKIEKCPNIVELDLTNKEKLLKLSDKVKRFVNLKSTVITIISVGVLYALISFANKGSDEKPIIISGTSIITEQGSDIAIEPVVEEQIEVESFDINEYISLENRIAQLETIKINEEKGAFELGSKLDSYALNKMTKFIENDGEIFFESGLKYGVDPYLLLSISMTESSLSHNNTIPGGKDFNGYAYGAMQVENVHIGETITAFNYETNDYETIEITKEKLMDYETNVQIGSMLMQKCLEEYNNNIYIAIQAHNYGKPTMNMIIQKYANEVGKTFDQVTSDINDLGWLKYVDDMHNNPLEYLSNWRHKTYGNNKYINNVLGYYMGQSMINTNENNYCIYDLINNTCEFKSISLNNEFDNSYKII